MYHDFSSAPEARESLAKQCAHIKKYYQTVTMADISRHLREGTALPSNALAVTVDDGNRDFLLNGYPIFQAHGIPVTVYLVSGFIDRKSWFWWDQLSYLMGKSSRTSFSLAFSSGQPAVALSLKSNEHRLQTSSKITNSLKYCSEKERTSVIQHLSELLDVKLPSEPPPEMAVLSWSEIRDLAGKGVNFGAHTVTHPVLSHIADSEELLEEIGQSKKRIEEELGRTIEDFCYPYGLGTDFNEETLRALDRCAFRTAVTAEHGLNSRQTHPFRLRRLSADHTFPDLYFQERLAGLHSG